MNQDIYSTLYKVALCALTLNTDKPAATLILKNQWFVWKHKHENVRLHTFKYIIKKVLILKWIMIYFKVALMPVAHLTSTFTKC